MLDHRGESSLINIPSPVKLSYSSKGTRGSHVAIKSVIEGIIRWYEVVLEDTGPYVIEITPKNIEPLEDTDYYFNLGVSG